MIFSVNNLFSDSQAVTATAASTNVIDLGATGTVHAPGQSTALVRDIGKGLPIPLQIRVVEAFATCTSVTVTVETDDNSAFSSATTIATTQAIPVATLVAGYRFKQLDSIPLDTLERYVRLKYTVAGSNATTGKITAGVTMGNQTNGAN